MELLKEIMPANMKFGEVQQIQGLGGLGFLPIISDAIANIPPIATIDEAGGAHSDDFGHLIRLKAAIDSD